MVDWNTPDNSSTYTNVLTNLNDKLSSVAKQSYGSDTNIPTNALRFNGTTKAREKWNGSSWVECAGNERAFRPIVTTAGTQPTYTVTNTIAWTAYTAGDVLTVSIHSSNTGSSTINVDGLGAKTVKYMGNNLVGGELTAKHVLVYDGTDFVLLNHGGGWATWTPTLSTNGVTLGSTAINTARYQRHGNRIDFIVDFTGTCSGSASNELRFTPPVAPAANYGAGGSCVAVDSSAAKAGFLQVANPMGVRKYDNSNWALTAIQVQATGFYYV
jgi:hypothetical protein